MCACAYVCMYVHVLVSTPLIYIPLTLAPTHTLPHTPTHFPTHPHPPTHLTRRHLSIDSVSNKQMNVLHYAAVNGQKTVAEWILTQGVDLNGARDWMSMSTGCAVCVCRSEHPRSIMYGHNCKCAHRIC